MERIIWDSAYIRHTVSRLQEAAEALEACARLLALAEEEATAFFNDNAGFSAQIARQIGEILSKVRTLSVRTGDASLAMSRTLDLIVNTENELISHASADDYQMGLTNGRQKAHGIRIGNETYYVQYVNLSELITGVVPEWLRQAAQSIY